MRADPHDRIDRLPPLKHGPAAADVRQQALPHDNVLGRVHEHLQLRAPPEVIDVADDEGHEEVHEHHCDQEGEGDEQEHGEGEREDVAAAGPVAEVIKWSIFLIQIMHQVILLGSQFLFTLHSGPLNILQMDLDQNLDPYA